jgi:hypothetical protein
LGIKREEGLRRRAIRLSALALLVACAAPVRAETVKPETIKIGLLKTSSSAVTADGKRQDQADAPAIYAIISAYVGQTVEQPRPALAYVDGQGRIDVDDVMRQIAWYPRPRLPQERRRRREDRRPALRHADEPCPMIPGPGGRWPMNRATH